MREVYEENLYVLLHSMVDDFLLRLDMSIFRVERTLAVFIIRAGEWVILNHAPI